MKLYGADGRRKDLPIVTGSGAGRLPSLNNPPASPSAYDDEFDSTTLSGNWTIAGTATTPTVGTVLPIQSVVTTPIYDLTSWPSWLMIQSDNAISEQIVFRKDLTPATDATYFFHMATNLRIKSSPPEGACGMRLTNSGDSNESVFLLIDYTTSGGRYNFGVENNGAVTNRVGAFTPDTALLRSSIYGVIYKDSNVYYGMFGGPDGTFSLTGASVTKTGVTTFDRIQFEFWTANETPSDWVAFDFFRYYDSNTFALVNP